MHMQAMIEMQARLDAREKEQAVRLAKLAGVADPSNRIEPELTATIRFGDPNLAALFEKEARVELNEESLAKLESVEPDTSDAPMVSVEEISGVGPDLARKLEAHGFETPESVREASDDELLAVEGIGPAKLQEIRQGL